MGRVGGAAPLMLRELLQSGGLLDRALWVRALGSPSLWPIDAELAQCAERQGAAAPPPPRSGETLLVSVNPERSSTALWRLAPPDEGTRRRTLVPFVAEAEESARTVAHRLPTDLPWLMAPQHLGTLQWRAEELLRDPRFPSELVLRGASFGLSMALAQGSLVLGSALSPDLMATATVEADGALGAVGGLASKLGRIHEDGLGIRVVMVARPQVDEASRVLAGLGSPIRVVGPATLFEALRLALPREPSSISDPARRLAVIRQFAGVVSAGDRRIPSWVAVERAAVAMLRWPELADEDRRILRVVQSICGRHNRNEGALPWTDDSAWKDLPDTSELEILAHVVQAHTDSGADELESVIERARAKVDAVRGPRADRAKCLGALGRALSLCRRHGEAVEVLRLALAEWRDLNLESESSRALCALLKVAPMALPRPEVDAIVRQALELPPQPEPSNFYLSSAIAEAMVLSGGFSRAIDELSHLEWHRGPEPLRFHRSRWLARAYDGLGDGELASTHRARASEAPGLRGRLPELDAVPVPSPQADALVGELISMPGGDARIAACLLRDAPAADRARVLRDEFPY